MAETPTPEDEEERDDEAFQRTLERLVKTPPQPHKPPKDDREPKR